MEAINVEFAPLKGSLARKVTRTENDQIRRKKGFGVVMSDDLQAKFDRLSREKQQKGKPAVARLRQLKKARNMLFKKLRGSK